MAGSSDGMTGAAEVIDAVAERFAGAVDAAAPSDAVEVAVASFLRTMVSPLASPRDERGTSEACGGSCSTTALHQQQFTACNISVSHQLNGTWNYAKPEQAWGGNQLEAPGKLLEH